jgi:hypothetical protein
MPTGSHCPIRDAGRRSGFDARQRQRRRQIPPPGIDWCLGSITARQYPLCGWNLSVCSATLTAANVTITSVGDPGGVLQCGTARFSCSYDDDLRPRQPAHPELEWSAAWLHVLFERKQHLSVDETSCPAQNEAEDYQDKQAFHRWITPTRCRRRTSGCRRCGPSHPASTPRRGLTCSRPLIRPRC